MAQKILVTGASIKGELLRPLTDAGYEVFHPHHDLKEDELIDALSGCIAYIYGGEEEASERALKTAKDLKLLAFYGVGYESFLDVGAVKNLGIRISNTPGTLTNSVAEMTVAQLINCKRKLVHYAALYRDGVKGDEEVLSDIGGHSVGIIGLGEIGTRIAEILTMGFGCNVSYYSRTQKPETERKLGIKYVSLNELFADNEAVIVMTPGNAETASLIGAEQLLRAKPGFVLVNTARPEIVDQHALLEALNTDRVACAAFDKFYAPSPETDELLAMQTDKLLITNHIGSLTHDARDAMTVKAVRSVLNFLASGTDENLVV